MMSRPVSKIIFEGKEIVNREKVGSSWEYTLADGSRLKNSKLGKIQIECNKCSVLKTIDLYYKIYNKYYVCTSCRVTGENNPFYGKQHSQEFKDKLSKERKGTWGVGEANAMFGKNVKDFVTPEKWAEMKEKNRQDTLSREYNPFRYSMREIIGDERFEASKRKASETKANWDKETREAFSLKIKEAAKKLKDKDPVAYSMMKSKGGLATARKQNNYKMNNLERKVSEWLSVNNIKHTYSPIMSNGERIYQFDFVLHGLKTLVECHGTYWHGDPRFYAYDETDTTLPALNLTQLKNIEKDKLKMAHALSKGFKLIIIWEHDVNNNNYTQLIQGLKNEIEI